MEHIKTPVQAPQKDRFVTLNYAVYEGHIRFPDLLVIVFSTTMASAHKIDTRKMPVGNLLDRLFAIYAILDPAAPIGNLNRKKRTLPI